jgi:hypothetical protein
MHMQWHRLSGADAIFAALLRRSVTPEAGPSWWFDRMQADVRGEDMLCYLREHGLLMAWHVDGTPPALPFDSHEPTLRHAERGESDITALVEVFSLLERWQCEADQCGEIH